MLCDICQRQAKGICKGCASYYCEDHGNTSCFRCSGAFLSTEPAPEPEETGVFTKELDSRRDYGPGYLPCYTEQKIPTVYLDDDPGPPECYVCLGWAHYVCQNCHSLFCEEHGKGKRLCLQCVRSSWLGVWAMLAAFFLLIGTAWLSSIW